MLLGNKDSDLKNCLDVVDEVRELFRGELGGKDKAFFDETLSRIPQFIVTGAQSAGKSSVLGRISSIRLPEKSKRCTRVAINLKLRRQDEKVTSVDLKCPEEANNESFDCSDVTKAIEDAQNKAIALSGNKEFAEGFSVDVAVYGPDMPNVTLVDLPGFTNSSTEDTAAVERIVKKYLEMEGTLVLHVGRGDSDYNSLLGNDIVRPFQSKLTNVFTYCDMLENIKPVDRAHGFLDTIVENTEAPRFILIGNQGESEVSELDKLNSLQALKKYETHFNLGVEALQAELENKMSEHMRANLPQTVEALKVTLVEACARAEVIRTKDPAEVILNVTQAITPRLIGSCDWYHNKLHALVEKMSRDILRLKLRCVALEGGDESRPLLALEEEEGLEPGTKVLYTMGDSLPSHLGVVVTSSAGGSHVIADGKSKQYCIVNTNIRVLESSTSSVLDDIKRVIEKGNGLRNLAHADPQRPIEAYAKDYAQRYGEVLEAFLARFASLARERLETIVFASDGLPEMGSGVLAELLQRALDALEKMTEDMKKFIHDVVKWNMPPLVFTPNDHYLDANFARFVEADSKKEAAKDSLFGKAAPSVKPVLSAEMKMYYMIQAYLKVQRKCVTEAAAKQFILVFHCKVDEAVKECLSTKLKVLQNAVQDPAGWSDERKRLKKRIAALEKGIGMLDTLFAQCRRNGKRAASAKMSAKKLLEESEEDSEEEED